jgi:uncharacterized protein (TIGR00661 family)
MKILYAIQGTGNGHISRARDIIPLLSQKGELDILISGIQADVSLPYPVKYRFKGLSFIFGKSGGVDIWNTYLKNKIRRLYAEIKSLQVDKYDLVINDFEPVSAWACYLAKKACIALSHQCAVLNENAPKPEKSDLLGRFILKYYAPSTAQYGFHFAEFAPRIFTPVIRQEVRNLTPTDAGHYTVYLPAYDDERIIKRLSTFKEVRWEVFSKHNREPFVTDNIVVRPINNEAFIQSMASATGVLCGAGFETPAEALFMGKKLLVIPMKTQYEQQCNAAALESIGVPVMKNLKKKHAHKIADWLKSDHRILVNFPDITAHVIDLLFEENLSPNHSINEWEQTEYNMPLSDYESLFRSLISYKQEKEKRKDKNTDVF